MDARGRDMISGLPRKTVVTSQEIREALREPISQILDAVTQTLEQCEPELAADLVDNGIHLCGGGALLRGLETVTAEATGLSVRVVDDPLSCVARGTSVYLENLSEWRDTLESDHDHL
jgi:rod shape-determining protein MreB